VDIILSLELCPFWRNDEDFFFNVDIKLFLTAQ